MKKLFLVGLMMLAGSAWAEWVMYWKSEDIAHYYDPATIRKEGSLRRVWELQELARRDASGERSRRLRSEIDCKEERNKLLVGSSHSELRAGGETLVSTDSADNWPWRAIPPGTPGEFLLKIVCSK